MVLEISLNIRCIVERTWPFQNSSFSTRVDDLKNDVRVT